MYQKNIILLIIFIFCLNSCISVKNEPLKETELQETKSENTMKYPDEIRKLFNGLLVDLGIEKVLQESDVFFEYAKTIHMLSYSEVWFIGLDTFTYFPTKADKVELRLERSFHELDVDSGDGGDHCYDAILRFSYVNDFLMKQEFNSDIGRIFDFGQKRENKSVYEEYEFVERIIEIGLIQDKETPTIHIFGNVRSEFLEPEITVVYRNCLD